MSSNPFDAPTPSQGGNPGSSAGSPKRTGPEEDSPGKPTNPFASPTSPLNDLRLFDPLHAASLNDSGSGSGVGLFGSSSGGPFGMGSQNTNSSGILKKSPSTVKELAKMFEEQKLADDSPVPTGWVSFDGGASGNPFCLEFSSDSKLMPNVTKWWASNLT